MGFTTPCFIRKNTKELKDKLESIGYKNCITEEGPYIFTLSGIFDCMHSECGLSDMAYNGLIDCGKNEELFLAIAALRDDSDIHQWFIMDIEAYLNLPKGKWFKATSLGGGYHVGCQIEPFYCHKATVEELINHFKI